MLKHLGRFTVLLVLAGLGFLAWGYWNALSDPVVRETRIARPDFPAGEKPVRIALLSDIHVAGPDMPPERLARIVGQVNALKPDLIVIAGDMVSDRLSATHHYPIGEALAPLGKLRAPMGVLAVYGNHDGWRVGPGAAAAVGVSGVTFLANQAVRRGPLVIGGADDWSSGRPDLPAAIAATQALEGVRIMLSHTPDAAPFMPDDIAIVMAGHTHCGQIRLPLIGYLTTFSNYGLRYACGRIEDEGRTVIVGAGLGTSILPLRYWTPPDLWLITIGR